MASSIPALASPINGGYVQQNDPETGCRHDPVYGFGFKGTFEWTGVNGFTAYEIQLKNDYASVPLLERHVQGTRHEYVACNVVVGHGDYGWRWKVRAVRPSGPGSVWSAPFFLNFTDCRLSNGLRCAEQSAG